MGGFAWAFRAWSQTIRETSTAILAKLESLGKDFHEHRVNNAERLATIETEIKHLEKTE